jgi:hypothetical protein
MDSAEEKKYNKLIVEKYKEFIGKKNLKTLLRRFDSTDILLGTWKQVSTSLTTSVIGTGREYSSVEALYTRTRRGKFRVLNRAYDPDFNKVSIEGEIVQIDNGVPTCLTVAFDSNLGRKGNYWICYATPSGKTIIVVVPLVVKFLGKPHVITNHFAHYILTRDSAEFWNSDEEREPTFRALKQLGFDIWYNRSRATGITLRHEDTDVY